MSTPKPIQPTTKAQIKKHNKRRTKLEILKRVREIKEIPELEEYERVIKRRINLTLNNAILTELEKQTDNKSGFIEKLLKVELEKLTGKKINTSKY